MNETVAGAADDRPTRSAGRSWTVVGETSAGVALVDVEASGDETGRVVVAPAELAQVVAAREDVDPPRWVWHDTQARYGALLAAGVRVARCHDLRLCHRILASSVDVMDREPLRRAASWDEPVAESAPAVDTLFDLTAPKTGTAGIEEQLAEFRRQRAALSSLRTGSGIHLLLAAESAGALVAAEMHAAGLPWDRAVHLAVLERALGSRPPAGGRPSRLEELTETLRAQLHEPSLNPDSPVKLLRALHRSGLGVESTNRWELERHDHPAVPTLLAYKRLARLWSANGWAWLDQWIVDDRFRPVYVPAGVVTGRWASSGGGALQIPRQLRVAVRADPGWRLVIADVAQLEPRVLCGMARDSSLADAARGRDLYEGIVADGAVASRAEAKIAMLGAMYGATTGESGRLVPRLRRRYPRAMALVDAAARRGEDGEVVATLLGRTSPAPSAAWTALQAAASEAGTGDAQIAQARRQARDRGRFTRNFVVQGTAAEWALAWLADLRTRLDGKRVLSGDGAVRSGPAMAGLPHIAFFLHDEVIVHTPADLAEAVAADVRAAAASAGRLLFGDFPIDFPLDVRVADSAEKS